VLGPKVRSHDQLRRSCVFSPVLDDASGYAGGEEMNNTSTRTGPRLRVRFERMAGNRVRA